MTPAVLPSAATPQPRTYLISGVLGVVLFTLSWLWWDRGQSFLGSLFLELGGGAFIVFLLEVLVPSALGYAATARAALATTTLLEWSDGAAEALLGDAYDEAERDWLLAAVGRGPYPARPTPLNRVADTGEEHHGLRVLARPLPGGRMTVCYGVRDGSRRRRTVLIVGFRHRRGAG